MMWREEAYALMMSAKYEDRSYGFRAFLIVCRAWREMLVRTEMREKSQLSSSRFG